MEDSCWEARLKTGNLFLLMLTMCYNLLSWLLLVMSLFRKSRSHKSPVVMAAVTMPCLKIIHSLINPKTSMSALDKVSVSRIPMM